MNHNLIEKQSTFLFSSDPVNGALNVRSFGSTFDVNFNTPFELPEETVACTIEVSQSTIPWIIPNISENLGNNHFYVTYNTINYDFTIADGLYGLSDLSAAISREFSNATPQRPPTAITWIGDSSTQKVVMSFSEDINVNFTFTNTMRELLGFDSRIVFGLLQAFE